MNTTRKIAKAMKDASKAKTSAYDTTAVVKRIEGNTAWVHIPGGVDETPVRMTINAKVGDSVQVRVSDGSAWLAGNASAPPTDDTTAFTAVNMAGAAKDEAESAHKAATEAWGYAEEAKSAAATAETHASEAKVSAQNASEYASRALGNLSTVQSVAETLTWITQHGTMTLTTDVALDPTHVYFVQDAGGDYVVGGVTYAVVTEPDVADIGTYYELTIDESLNNYVGTHLALTSEGLWLLPASSGTNRMLIATGAGSVYTTAGTYIIDSNGTTVVASFRANGATIGENANGKSRSEIGTDGMQVIQNVNGSDLSIAHLGYGPGTDSGGGTSDAPYYTLGIRAGAVGNYSTAEGTNTTASGYASHAEGDYTTASGYISHSEGSGTTSSGSASHAEGSGATSSGSASHAEGTGTISSGVASHAEGDYTTASGVASHSQNISTISSKRAQTALGTYNEEDTSSTTTHPSGIASYGQYSVIIGNGTFSSHSNALTVDWSGDVCLALDTTAASGTDHDLYAAITALGWQSDVIV